MHAALKITVKRCIETIQRISRLLWKKKLKPRKQFI